MFLTILLICMVSCLSVGIERVSNKLRATRREVDLQALTYDKIVRAHELRYEALSLEYRGYQTRILGHVENNSSTIADLVTERDAAHRCLELVLEKDLENNSGPTSVETEVGRDGVKYVFKTDASRDVESHLAPPAYFEAKTAATKVLHDLKQNINNHGFAYVSDFYDLISVTGAWHDYFWGWTSLDAAKLFKDGSSYCLELPTPVYNDTRVSTN